MPPDNKQVSLAHVGPWPLSSVFFYNSDVGEQDCPFLLSDVWVPVFPQGICWLRKALPRPCANEPPCDKACCCVTFG